MFFFFSSRRRHTRCLSDWSSDVCSSDLYETSALGLRYVISQVARDEVVVDVTVLEGEPSSLLVERSEERRVGKKCRSRWEPDHLKKKRKKVAVSIAQQNITI